MKKIITAVALFLGLAVTSFGQTPAPPTQHFVMSTTAGSFGGSPVAIASLGAQLTSGVSVAYEFLSNPNDSTKPRIGSGLANYTVQASRLVPAKIKTKLLFDLTNYNLTFQGGAGVESLYNGIGNPRATQIVGNFGAYISYPLPGGHVQISPGYKWILGKQGGLVKVPNANLVFTF